jgi:hypothetical protein
MVDDQDRPIYVIRVRARPGVDAIAALRQVLRRLLRSYGLVCVSITVESSLEVVGTYPPE